MALHFLWLEQTIAENGYPTLDLLAGRESSCRSDRSWHALWVHDTYISFYLEETLPSAGTSRLSLELPINLMYPLLHGNTMDVILVEELRHET